MLTRCDFLNKDGVTTFVLNSVTAPLKLFDPTVQQRVNTGRKRSQQHGAYPTQGLRDVLEIHCEGDLFGTDSANYWANRKSLIAALFGDPGTAPNLTDRKAGVLTVGFSGESEDYSADVEIVMFSAPLAALSPARTEYAVTFVSWNPWMIGVSSGNRHYIV